MLDIGCVTRWKLGPEETIYHIHTPATPSRRTANGQTGEKRGRDSGNQVMSNAIYRPTLFPASGGGSSRERDECRRYFLLHYCYHLPFNDQTMRDRLLCSINTAFNFTLSFNSMTKFIIEVGSKNKITNVRFLIFYLRYANWSLMLLVFVIYFCIPRNYHFYQLIIRPPFSTILEVNPAINSAKSEPESSVIGHTLCCHISRLLRLLIGRHFTRPIIISADVTQRGGH